MVYTISVKVNPPLPTVDRRVGPTESPRLTFQTQESKYSNESQLVRDSLTVTNLNVLGVRPFGLKVFKYDFLLTVLGVRTTIRV